MREPRGAAGNAEEVAPAPYPVWVAQGEDRLQLYGNDVQEGSRFHPAGGG